MRVAIALLMAFGCACGEADDEDTRPMGFAASYYVTAECCSVPSPVTINETTDRCAEAEIRTELGGRACALRKPGGLAMTERLCDGDTFCRYWIEPSFLTYDGTDFTATNGLVGSAGHPGARLTAVKFRRRQ